MIYGELLNQEEIAFCVLRKWYIKRCTTEQKVDCFLVISLVQYNNIRKAMYDILKSGEFHNLSISCQLELFDKVVKPILLYGYELSNCDIIERVYLKYCKPSHMIMCVSQIIEKSHSSKIVCSLFSQEQIAICVLRKWYIKRCTTEQKVDCFLVLSLVQYRL
jgi:hypothetical protein